MQPKPTSRKPRTRNTDQCLNLDPQTPNPVPRTPSKTHLKPDSDFQGIGRRTPQETTLNPLKIQRFVELPKTNPRPVLTPFTPSNSYLNSPSLTLLNPKPQIEFTGAHRSEPSCVGARARVDVLAPHGKTIRSQGLLSEVSF